MKKCVFVLGMHRSGTSALAGVLDKLGVALGNDLLAPTEENPKGFFENTKVIALNDKILSEQNTGWDDPRYEFNLSQVIVEHYVKDAVDILKSEFRYNKIFAVKDPRFCLTFPVWEKAAKDQGIDIQIIIPYRNPFEVAQSLMKRNDFSLEKGVLLWFRYFFHAELYSRKYPRQFVFFDSLVNKPIDTAKILNEFLDDDALVISSELESFVDKNLKHENLSARNVAEHVPIFLRNILNIESSDELNKMESHDFDLMREQYVFSYSMFHAPDVLYYTRFSHELHSQRDAARKSAEESACALQQVQGVVVDVQNKLEEAQAKNASLVQENAASLSDNEILSQQLEAQVQKSTLLQAQIEETEMELSSLKESKDVAEQRADILRHDFEAAQLQLVNLKQEHASALAENESLLQHIEEAEEKTKSLQAQIEEAAKDIALIKESKTSIEQHAVALQAEIDAVQLKNANLMQEHAGAITEKKALSRQLEVAEQETIAVQSQIEKVAMKLALMNEGKEVLEQKTVALLADLETAQLENANLMRENAGAHAEKEALLRQLEVAESEAMALHAHLDEVVTDLSSIKESKCWIYTKPIRDLQKLIK